MKILSMTATFGKLSRQTITLEPGMNVIEAPNEWGKSTWCAFMMAMLYGIDTTSRTKTGFLADKEHYAPWSGEPMSGSMTILWQGREITLERFGKGRTPLGEVRAFETKSGVPVPELQIAAPGQVLLGVERSVFARAGFLKLSEMPVTEDESLRRRLNELVTTGDESGASDDLAQKLRDLKNKCRFNKKGLLPEAEAKLSETEQKLQQLQNLQQQIAAVRQRQGEVDEQIRQLENHKKALRYGEQLQYTHKLTTAKMNADAAKQSLVQAEKECEKLPAQETIRQNLLQLQQLRDIRDELHTKSQLMPPMPPAPEAPEAFRGKDPEQATDDARKNLQALQQLKNHRKRPIFYILCGILVAIGIFLLVISQVIPAVICVLLGAICLILGISKQRKIDLQIRKILDQYKGIPADHWEQAAEHYAQTQQNYNRALADRHNQLADLNRRLEENSGAIAAITESQSLAQYEEICRNQLH